MQWEEKTASQGSQHNRKRERGVRCLSMWGRCYMRNERIVRDEQEVNFISERLKEEFRFKFRLSE